MVPIVLVFLPGRGFLPRLPVREPDLRVVLALGLVVPVVLEVILLPLSFFACFLLPLRHSVLRSRSLSQVAC